MVHPLMRQSPSHSSGGGSASPADTDPDQIARKIIEMLSRLHVLVIGPGLGRDPLMQKTCAKVLAAAREQKMPVVLDADALAIVSSNPELFMGWEEVVLTPNVVEFGRLWKGLKVEGTEEPRDSEKPTAQVEALSKALGGVTVVQKGAKDMISNGQSTMVVDLEGGLKRSGGQGDTLTGSIATFLGWRRAYLDGLWDHGNKLDAKELLGLAAFGGAAITRVSRRGHASHHPVLTHSASSALETLSRRRGAACKLATSQRKSILPSSSCLVKTTRTQTTPNCEVWASTVVYVRGMSNMNKVGRPKRVLRPTLVV